MEPCVKVGDLATMENQIKTLFKRQDKHEALLEALQNLATSIELVNQGQVTIQRDVEAIQADLGEIKGRPRENWETLVRAIIVAIVGVIIGYVFSRIGLKP